MLCMAIRHQENISLDGMLDRFVRSNGLLTKWDKRKANAVSTVINSMFSVNNLCNENYVKDRIAHIVKSKKQLEHLKTIPVIEQRSPQWHAVRKEIITASDFAQALGEGKFGTQKQIYQKKCGYDEEKAFNSSLPPLKWGTMFEPVASELYKIRFACELHEFGLIRHPTVDFFGASPDGITDYGVMVEIKCPYKRKITGEIPLQYYYQIQGQLDVCGLTECDYLECEFTTRGDSQDDGDTQHVASNMNSECGIILEFEDLTSSSGVSYQYSKVQESKDTLDTLCGWVESSKATTHLPFIRQHNWSLKVFSVVRVYKNDKFITEKLDNLKVVWDKIKAYQADKGLYTAEVSSTTSTREVKPKLGSNSHVQFTRYSFLPT
jgi:putative phage-type endonuclease